MALAEPKQHDIRVKVQIDPSGGKSHAVLEMPPGGLHVGQTVRYSCEDAFSLKFPDGSLFGLAGEKIVSGPEVLTLVKEGSYECQCSITPATGSPIRWSSSDPKSGGAHDVQA